jgi:integrase
VLAPAVGVAGESPLWVEPSEIPSGDDVATLGKSLRTRRHGERDELMANFAAYSGLRWGELAALTIGQVPQAPRVITVDRKVVGVGGRLYVEAPKNRKFRLTIYPRRTPAAHPLAERLAARIEEARVEQEAGTSPQGLIFPRAGAATGGPPTATATAQAGRLRRPRYGAGAGMLAAVCCSQSMIAPTRVIDGGDLDEARRTRSA